MTPAALRLAIAVAAALLVVLGVQRYAQHTGPRPPSAGRSVQGLASQWFPHPSLFVAPHGDDSGACLKANPCASPDRAYHLAKLGQVIDLAAGAYGDVTFTTDPTKPAGGCAAAEPRWGRCVVLRARGDVRMGELRFGSSYRAPGPASIAVVAGQGGTVTADGTVLNRPTDVATWGVHQRNLYITGGRGIAIRGGEIGGVRWSDGTHPEIQRVYGSRPLIVPENVRIEGVRFHDINTSNPTAHVDCLQVENARGIVIRGNTFERCGSVGLRMSYGAESSTAPPTDVLIEGNRFGRCADTPVSPCYYAAALGIGRRVVVRNNVADQLLQQTGDPTLASNVTYERNRGPGIVCESAVRYSGNLWTGGSCQ